MSRAASTAPRGSIVDGLLGQHAVLRALILRELHTRYGRDNIGYLWVIAEPMMLASVITTLHFVIEGFGSNRMGPYPFTLLGYAIFIIFRNTFNRAEGLLQGANTLFYHAQVTPFDIVLAKAIVEPIACTSALVVLMAIGIALGLADLPARPVYVAAAIFAMATLTFGMSLLAAVGTYKSHVLGHFIHPFSYFMFPLSGAFVTMAFLPPWARAIMAWNPLMSVSRSPATAGSKAPTTDTSTPGSSPRFARQSCSSGCWRSGASGRTSMSTDGPAGERIAAR